MSLFDGAALLQNILSVITIEPAEAQQATTAPVCRNDLCKLHQKIVMIFDSPLAESELQTTLNNKAVPLIEDAFDARFEEIVCTLTERKD